MSAHQHHKSKGTSNRIIAGLLAFLPAAFISIAAVACIAYFTVLSPGSFMRSFASSGYYSGVQSYSYEKMGDKLIPTGLPASVLANTLDEADVKVFAEASITGHKEALPETEADIAQRLHGNIAQYMLEAGIAANEVDRQELDEIVDGVVEFYDKASALPAASSIRSLAGTVRRILPFAAAVCALGAGLSVFILYRLLRWKHVLLRYLAWSVGGAGLILTVLPLIGRLWGGYRRISLSPAYLYSFMVQHIDNALLVFLFCGIALLLVCAALALLAEWQRKKVT